MTTRESDIAEVLRNEVGVPEGTETFFYDLGFTRQEVVAFLETARKDPRSPFGAHARDDLNKSLAEYAAKRGLSVGEGFADKLPPAHAAVVTTILKPSEQDDVVRELQGVARVKFTPSSKGTYTSHSVPYAVRKVHGSVLRRLVPQGSRALEVGANIPSMASAGVVRGEYHGCCPIIGMRDAARHDVDKRLRAMALNDGRAAVRDCASGMLASPSSYYCRDTVQQCTWQAEYILSNESCHDVDMDDIPLTMAKHGARAWYGFRARAPGLARGNDAETGFDKMTGFRWSVDRRNDTVKFQFAKSTSFGYTHSWSSWRKFEERVQYRWMGVYFDYVFMRMPGSTEASMFWGCFRVPKTSAWFRELNCTATGTAGLVHVKSFVPVRSRVMGDVEGFKPYEFRMEALALDKVVEQRAALGDKGHLVTTMSYMRSVRVLFYVNGAAVSAESRVATEILEAAAVVAELVAVESRTAGALEYKDYMSAVGTIGLGGGIASWTSDCLSGFAQWLGLGRTTSWLKEALTSYVTGKTGCVVTVTPCEAYELWDAGSGVVREPPPRMVTDRCTCQELIDVNAALASTGLTGDERTALEEYKAVLVPGRVASCMECSLVARMAGGSEESVSAAGDSGYVTDDGCDGDEFSDAVEFPMDVTVSEAEVTDTGEDVALAAAQEYHRWGVHSDVSLRSEVRVYAEGLFSGGTPPLKASLERAATTKVKHATVYVNNGVLTQFSDTVDGLEPAEVYCPEADEFHVVQKERNRLRTSSGVDDGVYYYNTKMVIMNSRVLAAAVHKVMTEGLVLPKDMLFVNGPFGCGKTRSIIATLRGMRSRDPGAVLYVTAGRANAERVAQSVTGNRRDPHIRTSDGALMHLGGGVSSPQDRHAYDAIYIDEMPMHHFGQVAANISMSGAGLVRAFGDVNQITFCTFSHKFKAEYALCMGLFRAAYMPVVHRCREDVCAAWVDRYHGKLRVCNCDNDGCAEVREEADSLSWQKIAGVQDLVYRPGVRYLTFTHAAKMQLVKAFGRSGSIEELRLRPDGHGTVHEDQGETFDEVVLVRTEARYDKKESRNSPALWNRLAYALTATTRHRLKFTYYTASEETDEVIRRIEASRCPYRRAVVRGEMEWSSVKDMAYDVPSADDTAIEARPEWFEHEYKFE